MLQQPTIPVLLLPWRLRYFSQNRILLLVWKEFYQTTHFKRKIILLLQAMLAKVRDSVTSMQAIGHKASADSAAGAAAHREVLTSFSSSFQSDIAQQVRPCAHFQISRKVHPTFVTLALALSPSPRKSVRVPTPESDTAGRVYLTFLP